MTKRLSGYKIRIAAAGSINCGEILPLYRECVEMWDLYRVENDAVIGSNVIAFESITGKMAKGQEEGY